MKDLNRIVNRYFVLCYQTKTKCYMLDRVLNTPLKLDEQSRFILFSRFCLKFKFKA